MSDNANSVLSSHLEEKDPDSTLTESRSGNIKSNLFYGFRLQWLAFFLVLFSYVSFLIYDVLEERKLPLSQIETYQQTLQSEQALIKADLAIFHVVIALFVDLNGTDLNAIVSYFDLLKDRYAELEKHFPDKANNFRQLVEFIPEVLITPRPENLATLTRQIAASKYELDKLMEENLNRREQLIEEIREHNDETLLKTLLLGVVGITLFGVATGIFFLQLTSDLRRLNRRVAEVVSGYRGPMLSTDRKDEVGELIRGVNEMTDTLMVRERELEIERRKHSHLEKMEAIEHLIGGIAHEINNPVSAIDGLARLVLKNQQDCKCEDSESHNESRRLEKSNLEEILRYSSNLTRTMRDLHVLAATGGDRYELFDFNQLVSQTCGILKLGSISELIHLDLKLDPHSPAFYGIKEQMGLVISAILDNAIHAVGDSSINQPRITVTTSVAADSLICQITDNGSGIAPDILKHLFESSLTVRSSEGPTGLGLPICQSIITSLRGTIELESEIGQGTTVTVKLPIHTDSDIALAVGEAS